MHWHSHGCNRRHHRHCSPTAAAPRCAHLRRRLGRIRSSSRTTPRTTRMLPLTRQRANAMLDDSTLLDSAATRAGLQLATQRRVESNSPQLSAGWRWRRRARPTAHEADTRGDSKALHLGVCDCSSGLVGSGSSRCCCANSHRSALAAPSSERSYRAKLACCDLDTRLCCGTHAAAHASRTLIRPTAGSISSCVAVDRVNLGRCSVS